MNMKIKYYSLFLFILLANFIYAQEANNDRMKRDIEVAENILATLLKQNVGFGFISNVEGTYIEGHGAMFTIGSGGVVMTGNDVLISGYGSVLDLRDGSKKKVPLDQDSLRTATQNNLKNVMKVFLTDYAQLLSQLKNNEKVLLRYGARHNFGSNVIALSRTNIFTASESDENPQKELTAELSKAVLDDFRSGKLTKAQLEQKIKYTEQSITNKKETDLELLSSIFHRLYQNDLSETFRLYGDPSYEKIEGLGVIFNMNFGSFFGKANYSYSFSTKAGSTVWSASPGQGQNKNKSEEEEISDWQQKMEEAYPDFLETFKQNMIEYGRTVRNLNADELLIFKLDLMNCEDCDMPKEVELAVKKSVLEDYDKNKITLAQAVEKITVKETRNN
ncbi:MAG: hypothetical protein ACK4TA_24415 [Saprospiraceae bacterium]